MIKNIIFDVDGVLVDVNQCYIEFLKKTYQKFESIVLDDLPVLFPILRDDGAIKLPDELLADFHNSPYYSYRPLFKDTKDVLQSLKQKGLKLFTLSAAGNPEKKLKWLSEAFGDVFDAYEFSPSGESKTAALTALIEKYALNKQETAFIDDRIQHIRSGISAGIYVIRMEPEISLPLPKDLEHIHVVKNMTDFKNFIDKINGAAWAG